MTDDRPAPPLRGGERETLRTFLDFHRATLAVKCAGLDDQQLRQRSMPPSTLSLLGLVRHMAEVERTWFRRVIDGQDVPLRWSAVGDFQEAYTRAAARAPRRSRRGRRRSRTPAGSRPRRPRSTSPASSRSGTSTSRCAW